MTVADGEKRAVGDPIEQGIRDMSNSRVRTVSVVYGLALTALLFDASGSRVLLRLDRHAWAPLLMAMATTFIMATWHFMGYSSNMERMPYDLLWTAGRKKTASEEWRFVVDLVLALGFGALILLSRAPGTKTPGAALEVRLTWLLWGIVVIRGLTLLSAGLRSVRWDTPPLRHFDPDKVSWLSPEWALVGIPALIALWYSQFDEPTVRTDEVFLGITLFVAFAHVVTERQLAKAQFT